MSIRRAALWSMGSQYAAFVIQFATSVIISRFFLGPAEVGLFSIALATALLVAVLQDFGITRFVSGQPGVDAAQIRAATSVSILFAWAIALLVAAMAWPVAHFYGDMRLAPLLLIIGASYLISPFAVVPQALMARAMDYRQLFSVNVSSALAGGITALSLAAVGYSAAALAWAMIVQALVRVLIAQRLRPVAIDFRQSLADLLPVLRFGSASAALCISGAIGMKSQDLVIGRLLGLESVGLYSRATALAATLAQLVTGAVNAVFYPAFARMRDAGEPMGPPYLRVVAGNCAVNWPAMVAMALAAEPIILMLYGPKWADAASLLKWIALSEIFYVALPLHMDIPILLGRIRSLIWYNAADTAISVSFLLVAARWGLEAAAMSRIAYGMVWTLIYGRFLHQLIGFSWSGMLSVYLRSALVTAATVAPLLAAYAWWRTPATLGFTGLLGCAAAGALCWIAALFAVRHPGRSEIIAMLTSLTQRPIAATPAL